MTVQELIDILQQIPDKDTRQVITGGGITSLALAEQVVLEDVGGIGPRYSFDVIATAWLTDHMMMRQEFLTTPGVKVLAPNRPLQR